MPSEPLSDMLKLLNAKSVLTGAVIAGGAWSIRFPPPEKIKFWGIVKGCCWLQTGDEGVPIKLQSGDVLLVLRPTPITLASDLGVASISHDELRSRQIDEVSRIGDGEDEDFILIGGTAVLDPSGRSLLFDALPPMIRIDSGTPQAEALHWILDQMVRERANRQPGAGAALTQLAHLLFIHILRAHLQRQGSTGPGWLRLASDRRLAPALALMHEQPGKDWRLPELAKAAGMSRATFALHFKTASGVGPLGYLTAWRMRLAERALRQNRAPIAKLAESLGYANESAFSHAFKRVTGRAPKRVHREEGSLIMEPVDL
jgi:AraC-like DNA-binding protein